MQETPLFGQVTLTQLIAFYAALVATGTLVWTFIKDWNDRGRMRVRIWFRELVGNGQTEHDVLVWQITSIGKKSVMLTHVGARMYPTRPRQSTGILIVDHSIPKRLEPGDSHATLCKEFGGLERGIVRAFVTDSLGNEYYAPQGDVDAVNKQMRELAAKGIKKSWIER